MLLKSFGTIDSSSPEELSLSKWYCARHPPPPFMVFQMHGHTRKWDPGNRSKRGEVSNGSGSIPRIGEGHGSVNNASENMSKKWCWGWVLTVSVNKPRLYRGGADCTFNQWRKTVDYCLKVVFLLQFPDGYGTTNEYAYCIFWRTMHFGILYIHLKL